MRKEYAFDLKLDAVARVMADSEAEARAAIRSELQCIDISLTLVADNACEITLTEASCNDMADLFEINGEAI